jgi:hypothetical protein
MLELLGLQMGDVVSPSDAVELVLEESLADIANPLLVKTRAHFIFHGSM